VPGVHPTLSGNGAEASEQAVEVPGFRAEAPTEDAIGESVLAAVEDDAAEEAETALLPEDVALPAPASKRPDTSRNFSVPPPSVGVEIIESFVRKGNRYHSIKDLRNNQVVQNVTRNSARKLWQYAISQAENNPARPDKCQWIGDIGLFQTATRAQKQRYDLVQRDKFGRIHTYYGVTQEGMEGPWRAFLTGADLAPAPTGQPLDSVDDLFEDVISEPTALALDDIAASEPLSGVSGIADADFADRVSLPVETEQEGIGADDRRRPEAEGGTTPSGAGVRFAALRWTMGN